MREILSYDPFTGVLKLNKTLDFFHFGAFTSTFADYGVDMRGEVALLNRDIKITRSTDDMKTYEPRPWGCRILVADFFESNLTYRKGSLNMDNVEVDKCD